MVVGDEGLKAETENSEANREEVRIEPALHFRSSRGGEIGPDIDRVG